MNALPTQSQPPAAGEAAHTKTFPRYFWEQNYEIGEGSMHWALNDTHSTQEGKVSCCYMVLLADYPTCMDGKPLSEQDMPKRIVELLNIDSRLAHDLSELRVRLTQCEADRDREAAKVDKLTAENAALREWSKKAVHMLAKVEACEMAECCGASVGDYLNAAEDGAALLAGQPAQDPVKEKLVDALELAQIAIGNTCRLARFESKKSLEAVAQCRRAEEKIEGALAAAKGGAL